MKSAVLIFVLVCAAIFAGQCHGQDLPPLDGISGTGCDITGYQTGAFHVHVWADYLDKRIQKNAQHGWIKLYVIRSQDKSSKNRDKALSDCDKWMGKIEALRDKQEKQDKKAKAATEADSSHGTQGRVKQGRVKQSRDGNR